MVSVSGELVDFGFMIGVLMKDFVMWLYNGVEYMFVFKGLELKELLMVVCLVIVK